MGTRGLSTDRERGQRHAYYAEASPASPSCNKLVSSLTLVDYLGTLADYIDPEKIRTPPLPATPTSFPPLPKQTSDLKWKSDEQLGSLQAMFCRISRQTDITQDHLEILNIDFCEPGSLHDLLPAASDGMPFVPSLDAKVPDAPTTYAAAVEANRTPEQQRRRAFHEAVAGLRQDNVFAFQCLHRITKDGVRSPKLTYMRDFWEGIEKIARHWDTSMDEYFPEDHPGEVNDSKRGKRRRADSNAPMALCRATDGDADLATPECLASPVQTQADIRPEASSCTAQPDQHQGMRYRGLRMSNGSEMPEQYRTETVQALVEAAVRPFICSTIPTKRPPFVHLERLMLPIRQTAAVFLAQTKVENQSHARQFRGPVLALQMRDDTRFAAADGSSLEAICRIDALREVGSLLYTAQERRQGRIFETKPGEGAWWTVNPRWGSNKDDKTHAARVDHAIRPVQQPTLKVAIGRQTDTSRTEERAKALWVKMKPPESQWDPKVDYAAVGKPEGFHDVVRSLLYIHHHSMLTCQRYSWCPPSTTTFQSSS